MTRRLRLKCPACQAALEVACSTEPLINVTCPKCAKRFAAKVPVVQAKPVAKPVVAQPVASAEDDLWSMPLGIPPLPSTPMQSQAAFVSFEPHGHYRPTVHRKRNTKVWIWSTVITACLLAAIPIIWLGSGLVAGIADGGWSNFTLIRDSQERLTSDHLAFGEKYLQRSLAADLTSPNFRSELLAYVKSERPASERMFLRAVKLPKADRTQRPTFEAKMKELGDKYRDQLMAKAKAAGPNIHENANLDLDSDTEVRDASLFSSAASTYITSGIWDLPAPENDTEKIYYEEAELVRAFLRSLARVNSNRQAKKIIAEIEKQSDQMLELAVQRGKLPASHFDRVPREYADIERAFSLAQRALLRRLDRDYDCPEELKDAIGVFAIARKCIAEAAGGTSEPALRKGYDEGRAALAKSDSSSKAQSLKPQERDLVVKPPPTIDGLEQPQPTTPSAESQPAESKPAQTKSQASKPEQVATNTESAASSPSQPAQSDLAATPAPAESTPVATAVPADNSQAESYSPSFGMFPGLRSRNRPRGMQEGSSEPDHQSARPPRGEIQGSRAGMPQMPSLATQLERFSGPTAVTITVENCSQDVNPFVKQLVAKLSVRESFFHSSGGKAVIGLRYAGPIEEVTELIDIGTVVSVDHDKRAIVVSGK